MNIDLEFPPKLEEFMLTRIMYQVLYGGRSSGKSATAIRKLIMLAIEKPRKILCTREIQASIEHSTYAELRQFIIENDLTNVNNPIYFIIKSDGIITNHGSQFLFRGLARDIMQIKSIPDIDVIFIEEADTIIDYLWDVLDPTLRKANSMMIICFNPREKTSATYRRWIDTDYGDDIYRCEINYPDNPFNSLDILKKIERMRTQDYAKYEHIYLGKVLDMTEDVIFKGHFEVGTCDIIMERGKYLYNNQFIEVYYGMDFGFSPDPLACVESFLIDKDTIYISREIYKYKFLPTKIPELIKQDMPEAIKKRWEADQSRSDTIAELKHMGLDIWGAEKGTGSVESGLEWLKGKRIIVHPSCTNMIFEFYNYRHKKDKNTGNITTGIIDSNNHLIDALRYAYVKHIKATKRRPIRINPNAFKQLGINQ